MTHIAFSLPATLLIKDQEPKPVDVVIHVPPKTDALLAFTAKHPKAKIVG